MDLFYFFRNTFITKIKLNISMEHKIVIDPDICHGKPTIKGTRVLVSVILDYIAEGSSREEILEAFPSITNEDIIAAIKYAREIVEATHFAKYKGLEISS